MNRPLSKTSSPRERGLTLIELLGGLAILGMLLSGILIARGQHVRQYTRAERQLVAAEALEALLIQWWEAPEELPRRDAGQLAGPDAVPGDGELRWRTRSEPVELAEEVTVERVTVSVSYHPRRADAEELFEVQLLAPEAEPNPANGESTASALVRSGGGR